MIRYENDCVDCATESYPCDPFCSRRHAKHFYCDRCGYEDTLYWYNGEQLCLDCIREDEDEEDPDVEEVDEDEEE